MREALGHFLKAYWHHTWLFMTFKHNGRGLERGSGVLFAMLGGLDILISVAYRELGNSDSSLLMTLILLGVYFQMWMSGRHATLTCFILTSLFADVICLFAEIFQTPLSQIFIMASSLWSIAALAMFVLKGNTTNA
ncbi:hypothetical protein HNP46_000360 [Pseudomonas nitritireducens]|uniref:Uncharacterized protein n=1 Tax=Pseudomonas nitroreducens TaxID=46680 RepID=A0A7W7KFU8_PSENT|nr:hypothetical protein [Pseudomonas nitritireducens]MBB4861549.1 hypothetical protein [Pseudomonas nitritireducens]